MMTRLFKGGDKGPLNTSLWFDFVQLRLCSVLNHGPVTPGPHSTPLKSKSIGFPTNTMCALSQALGWQEQPVHPRIYYGSYFY